MMQDVTGVVAASVSSMCQSPSLSWSRMRRTQPVTTTTLSSRPARGAHGSLMLTGWAPRTLTRKDPCAPREGREDNVVVDNGWVRRMRLHENDGDWNNEMPE